MIETPLDPGHVLTTVANELIDARLGTGSSIRFTVPTHSMSPTLLPGDHVIVNAVKFADLQLGDILVVRQQGAWLVHRLIGRSIRSGNYSLLLKGDNSAEPDSPYSPAAVYGIVETLEHAGRAYDLRSRRAVGLGRVMAGLSGLEASSSRVHPYVLGKLLSKGSRSLLQGLARLGKWVIP